MIEFSSIIAATILFILIKVFFFNSKQPQARQLPGPSRFCLRSQLMLFKKQKHIALTELTNKYGHIYNIYIGTKRVIVLNSYEAIKEALVLNGDSFLERPHIHLFDWFGKNQGITFAHGKVWREQRHFTVHTMEYFGFGNASIEDRIMIEVQHVIEEIESYKGKKFELHYLLDKATVNIISSLVFDKRFDYNDVQLEKKLKWIEVIFANFSLLNPVNFFLITTLISGNYKEFKKATNSILDYIASIVEEHEATYQPDSHRDFIDEYIRKMKDEQIKNVKDTTFTKGNLVRCVETLLLGGTEIVSTTLMWSIKYLMLNPEKERKVIEELDFKIGVKRPISLADRQEMPYTEATLLETHRMASVVPLSLYHTSTEGVKVFDYSIPKGSMIIPNIYAVHNDERHWQSPKQFRPERFLDIDGHLEKHIESLIPFSMGKRDCLGKSLAKMELTLFLSNLLHRFEFVTPPEEPLPNVNNYYEGAVLRPHGFNVIAKPRGM